MQPFEPPESVSVTLAEYANLPEPESYRIELVRGRLVREPLPGTLHGRVGARLTYELESFARRVGNVVVLDTTGFVLEEEPPTVRGPDIAVVSRHRIPRAGYAQTFWHLGPDLVVEILSPSNRRHDLAEKIDQYISAGTRVVWLVDPRRRAVTVHEAGVSPPRTIESGGTLSGAPVLPGFSLALADLFAV